MSADVLAEIFDDLVRARAAARGGATLRPLTAHTEAVLARVREGDHSDEPEDVLSALDELEATDEEATTLLALKHAGTRPTRELMLRADILNRRLREHIEDLERFLAATGKTAEFERWSNAQKIAI